MIAVFSWLWVSVIAAPVVGVFCTFVIITVVNMLAKHGYYANMDPWSRPRTRVWVGPFVYISYGGGRPFRKHLAFRIHGDDDDWKNWPRNPSGWISGSSMM